MVLQFCRSLPLTALCMMVFALPCCAQDVDEIFADDSVEIHGTDFEHWLSFTAEDNGVFILLAHNSSVDLGIMLQKGLIAFGRVDCDHYRPGNEAAVFQVEADETYYIKIFAVPGSDGLPDQFQVTTTFIEGATINNDFYVPGNTQVVPLQNPATPELPPVELIPFGESSP